MKLIPCSIVTWTKVISRIADADEIPDRTDVLMPVYTNITIREFEEYELTNAQLVPFEIVKTKYIPRSPGRDFGKHDNEAFEYVDVIDTVHIYRTIKPYVVLLHEAFMQHKGTKEKGTTKNSRTILIADIYRHDYYWTFFSIPRLF